MGYIFSYGLAGLLSRLSSDRLKRVEKFWEIDAAPAPRESGSGRRESPIGEVLAQRLTTPWAAMAAVEKLNPTQIMILRAVTKPRAGPQPTGDLVRMAGGGAAWNRDLTPMLDVLVLAVYTGRAYYAEGELWHPNTPVPSDVSLGTFKFLDHSLVAALAIADTPWQVRRSLPLEELLVGLDLPSLANALALSLHALLPLHRQAGRLIAANLSNPDQVKRVLAGLSARARRIFEELARTDEAVPLRNLLSGPASDVSELVPTLLQLGSAGLIFGAFRDGKRACFVHPRVQAAARGQTPPLPTVSDVMHPVEAPEPIWTEGLGLLWNLMVVGRWIEAGGAKLTRARDIPKRTAERLVKTLAPESGIETSPTDRIVELVNVLGMAGLLTIEDDTLNLTGRWDAWTRAGLMDQVGHLLAHWIGSADVDESMGIGIPGLGNTVRAIQEVRWKLMGWLTELPVNEWYRAEDFGRRILAREPFFLRPREEVIRQLGAAGLQDLYESWALQEGKLINSEMYGLPFEAGLLEFGNGASADSPRAASPGTSAPGRAPLSHTRARLRGLDEELEESEAEGSLYFRVSEFGGRVLEHIRFSRAKGNSILVRIEKPIEESAAPLLVQPTLEVVMLEMVPPAAYSVARFAEPRSFDRVGHFALTAESVRAAANRGLRFDAMIGALKSLSAQPVPQNVEYQLKEWAGSIRSVRFERGTVVEVDSPADLDALLASKAIKTRLRRRLSPTAALLSVGEDIGSLSKLLESAGFRWEAPKDWEETERAAYRSIHRTLRRFEVRRW